jgi:hypothetical protein
MVTAAASRVLGRAFTALAQNSQTSQLSLTWQGQRAS